MEHSSSCEGLDQRGGGWIRRTASILLPVLAAFSLGLMFLVRHLDYRPLKVPLLVLTSSCCVLLALARGAFESRYGRLIFVALTFCWFGDLLGPFHFMAGLWAFLLAHAVLIAAFSVRGIAIKRMLVPLAGFALLSGLIISWLYPYVPKADRIPVLAYCLLVTLVPVAASSMRVGRCRQLTVTAATLFYFNDIFVARWRFVSGDGWNAYLVYPFCYSAAILYAFSVSAECEQRTTKLP